MSDYGLLVKNAFGAVVIDSTFKSYIKTASGTLAASVGSNTLSITSTPNFPIIAIRPPSSGYAAILSINKSGSNFTGYEIYSSASQNISWVRYELIDTSGYDTGYGMNVYNSDGDIVFSSNEDEYYKILNRYLVPSLDGNLYYDLGYTVSSNEKYVTVGDVDNNFFTLVRNYYAYTTYDDDLQIWFPSYKRHSSTVISLNWGMVEVVAPTSNNAGSMKYSEHYIYEIQG